MCQTGPEVGGKRRLGLRHSICEAFVACLVELWHREWGSGG